MGQSWSGLRRELEEDLICDSLKGRVKYFLTHYHGAPDKYGRVCVRVDGKEVVKGNPYDFYVLVRMLAVMDRRIGKRTLLKLVSEVEKQPNWLAFFYKLRLDADGIKL